MADELQLPKLAWNAHSQSFSNNRKRIRLSSPPVFSSDPAIFSSDDDPSADNYTQERRKRKYRGPWYQQIPASEAGEPQEQSPKKKTKRIFERQFDSGVFMGSDGTDLDDGDELELGAPSKLPLRKSQGATPVKKLIPSAEELAQDYIGRCLDDGVEIIDLSSRGLSTLSNATIRPLASFTRVPAVTEGVFSKLEPKLKLFLACNDLTSLPAEMFGLDRLTVLSLRANKLHELPPGIGNLTNLRELNLSQNGLRYLPFEILYLFSDTARLQGLHLHPNLFHEPVFPENTKPSNEAQEQEVDNVQYKVGLGRPVKQRRNAVSVSESWSELQNRKWHEQWKITYQARTEVRFLDFNGSLVQGPEFPGVPRPGSKQHKLAVADETVSPKPPKPRGNGLSRAPSLLEVALAACARSPQLPLLASYLPEDSPAYMSDALALAEAKKESGGSKCTKCGRNFIIARTEWIEWWEIAKVSERSTASAASPLRQMENERDVIESMVPLMRRGCSWFCVPEIAPVARDPEFMEE